MMRGDSLSGDRNKAVIEQGKETAWSNSENGMEQMNLKSLTVDLTITEGGGNEPELRSGWGEN